MATLMTIPEMVQRYTVDGRKLFSEWFLYTKGKQGEIPGYIRIAGKVLIDVEAFERQISNTNLKAVNGGDY